MAEYKVGQTVETSGGAKGIIRYIGEIAISNGQFIGLELPDASGKNDGSISTGARYFSCKPFHGLFCRPATITRIVAQPAPSRPTSVSKPKVAPRTSLRPTSVSGPAKPPPKPAPTNRLSMTPSSQQAASTRSPSKRLSVASSSTAASSRTPAAALTRTTRPAASSSAASTTSRPTSHQPKAAQTSELETRIKHLEKQHENDKELLKELETTKGKLEKFEGIIQKLQAKCQTHFSEVSGLKAQLKDTESERERLSRNEQEAESILELATLDREMAEERAEQAESELDTLRQKLEEQALELEILASERELLTEDMSEEEKQAAGYYRLQNENGRLKEALFRLKELTEETEQDLKTRVQELEEDLTQTEALREERDNLQAQITESEAVIEDLRQQIDAKDDSSDMIDELYEQNEQLKDKLAEKDIAIRDLENLKELNDELEMHHIEQANDLRVELEARDVELAENTQRVTEQESTIVSQQDLIDKYRDLVLDLQSKMNDAESSKNMSEAQAKDVTDRFHDVMELNRRLHNTQVTNTNKTIGTELQRLQAEEALEELEIVKNFLTDLPEVRHNDSLRAYFRAKRIDFKSGLAHTLIGTASVPSPPVEDQDYILSRVARLTTLRNLALLRLKARQFWNAVSSADLHQFSTFAPAFQELNDVEKAVESCLQALKSDELNFRDLSSAVRGANNIIDGVNADFKEALASRPEDEILSRIASIKAHAEHIKASFDEAKGYISAVEIADENDQDGSTYVLERLSKPADESSLSLLAATKLIRTLENLQSDGLYPRFQLGVEELAQQDEQAARLGEAAEALSIAFMGYLVSNKSKSPTISATDINNQAETYFEAHFPPQQLPILADITTKLNTWNEYAAVLMNNVEIEHGPAPWILKAEDLEVAKKQSTETEKKFQLLTQEHQTIMLQVRERDEIIETKELENEHLKSKHRDASAKVQELQRMEADLQQTKLEYEEFRKQVGKQIEDIKHEARKEQSERSEAAESQPRPKVLSDPGEKPEKQNGSSASVATLVQALTNENHWLRRRENKEMFGHNIKDMFAQLRNFQVTEAEREARQRQTKLDEMLAMTLNLEKSELTSHTKPNTQRQTHKLPDLNSKASVSALASPTADSHGRSPVFLAPLNTSSKWSSNILINYSDLEDLSFMDLSPVVENFSSDLDQALESYSEGKEHTLDSIM